MVLVQEQEDGPRVIACTNCSLSDVERQYSQTEKEAVALVWACEKLHPYIYWMYFELVTDHKQLQTIFSPRSKPCACIERWFLQMHLYAFKIIYAPGRQNIADPLSRLMGDESPGQGNLGKLAEDYVRFVAMTPTPSALTTQEVEKASKDDHELSAVCVVSCLCGSWRALFHWISDPVWKSHCFTAEVEANCCSARSRGILGYRWHQTDSPYQSVAKAKAC